MQGRVANGEHADSQPIRKSRLGSLTVGGHLAV